MLLAPKRSLLIYTKKVIYVSATGRIVDVGVWRTYELTLGNNKYIQIFGCETSW